MEKKEEPNSKSSGDKFASPQFIKIGEVGCTEGGLTKREFFAAMTMQAAMVNPGNWDRDTLASEAVRSADALILALKELE